MMRWDHISSHPIPSHPSSAERAVACTPGTPRGIALHGVCREPLVESHNMVCVGNPSWNRTAWFGGGGGSTGKDRILDRCAQVAQSREHPPNSGSGSRSNRRCNRAMVAPGNPKAIRKRVPLSSVIKRWTVTDVMGWEGT
jgi:hypothetical protein